MQRNIWTLKEYLLEFRMLNTLEVLFNLARDRKINPVEGSYTNKLLKDKNVVITGGSRGIGKVYLSFLLKMELTLHFLISETPVK